MVGQETVVGVSSLSMQETWAQSLCWEDPLEKKQPHQYSCLENPTDRGA